MNDDDFDFGTVTSKGIDFWAIMPPGQSNPEQFDLNNSNNFLHAQQAQRYNTGPLDHHAIPGEQRAAMSSEAATPAPTIEGSKDAINNHEGHEGVSAAPAPAAKGGKDATKNVENGEDTAAASASKQDDGEDATPAPAAKKKTTAPADTDKSVQKDTEKAAERQRQTLSANLIKRHTSMVNKGVVTPRDHTEQYHDRNLPFKKTFAAQNAVMDAIQGTKEMEKMWKKSNPKKWKPDKVLDYLTDIESFAKLASIKLDDFEGAEDVSTPPLAPLPDWYKTGRRPLGRFRLI